MKTLFFDIPNNLSLLHDEILTALPTLRPTPNSAGILDFDGDLDLEPVMMVEGDGNLVRLTVPDDADEAAIDAIVQAHDATAVPLTPSRLRGQRIEELLALGRSNWTAAQRNELLELIAQRLA